MTRFHGLLLGLEKQAIPKWDENRIIIAFIIVGGFVLGYNDFNIYRTHHAFDAARWGIAFILAMMGSIIAIYANVLAQKSFAYSRGLKTKSTMNYWKITASLLIGVFSNGYAPLMFSPDMESKIQPYKRLGRFRYAVNIKDFAKMGAMGSLVNFIIAGFLRGIFGFSNPITNAIIIANIFAGFSNALPIPKSPGFYAYYATPAYFLLYLGFAATGIFLITFGPITAFIYGALSALGLYLMSMVYVERAFA